MYINIASCNMYNDNANVLFLFVVRNLSSRFHKKPTSLKGEINREIACQSVSLSGTARNLVMHYFALTADTTHHGSTSAQRDFVSLFVFDVFARDRRSIGN